MVKKKMMEAIQMHVKIPKKKYEELRRKATQEYKSMSLVIRELIDNYLEDK